MQNYKKLAIEHFKNRDFKTAKLYFSLAYEKRKNKRLLNFISLCDLALNSQEEEAMLLFAFYLEHYNVKAVDKDFEELLSNIETKNIEQNEELEEGHALNYKDFLETEENLGFKKSFENVIYTGKLVIDNREDFLDFLEKLLDNGYKDVTLSYVENVAEHFSTHRRFLKIQERLKGFKSDIKISK